MTEHLNHLVDAAPMGATATPTPARPESMVSRSGDESGGQHIPPTKQLQPRAHETHVPMSGLERAMAQEADRVHPPKRR